MKNTNWWLILLQGLVAIIFGLVVILWPIKSLVAITWLIGAFLLLESVLLLISSFFNRDNFANLFLQGVVFIVFSLLILGYPQMTLKALFLFFAIWSIVAGIIQIIISMNTVDDAQVAQISLFSGIFSLIVGVLLLTFPVFTITISQIIFGLTMLVSGFGSIVYAFKVR